MASRRKGSGAMHAFPAAHHMLVKSLARSGRVAGGDLVDDVAMLARGYRKRPVLSEGLASEKMELVTQPASAREKLPVAGKHDQPLVKVQVQRVIGIDIVLRRGAIHPLDDRSQCLELFRSGGAREAPSDPFVEGGANFVDFVGFLDTDLAHEHAAILFQPHQARFLERAKRLTHGTPRDTEEIGYRPFVQLGAGGK